MASSAAALPARLSFLDARAKERALAAVRAFEGHTSAELVVTVKKAARTYPEVDVVAGAVAGFLAILFLLFYPKDFSIAFMPVDVAFAFGTGFGLSRALPPLRRLALSEAKRTAAVELAAKGAFVDLGVSRTTGRTGVLVYVALFEGLVAVVADVGVSAEAARVAMDARAPLRDALARSDMGAFAATLEGLGPRFAATMARSADDVNELPDEVS
jgi:putative membrane protein